MRWAARRGTRSTWYSVMLVVGVSIAVTSCSGGAPEGGSSTGVRSASPVTSGASATSHFHDPCTSARPLRGPLTRRGDLTLGPLTYAGLAATAHLSSAEAPPLVDGSTFYKTGAQLPAKTSATITIVAPGPASATIVTESGPKSGTSSVTYTNCTDTARWWVGGFVLRGRRTGCVTVEVTSSVDATPRRADISLDAGDCGGGSAS